MASRALLHKEYPLDCRNDFPLFDEKAFGKPQTLAYMDTAASAQKPHVVLDEMKKFSSFSYANIHRGVYRLSEQASSAYESARATVADWIGSKNKEIIFTSNATMGLNLVAYTLLPLLDGRRGVLTTELEHHSNFVPWQQSCRHLGLPFHISPCHADGTLDIEACYQLLQTKDIGLLAVSHVSNVTGAMQPIRDLCAEAHRHGVLVVVDGCQAAPHVRINVGDLDCDFYVFSSHKVYGPSGVGVLYGKYNLLDSMPPFICGGGMVSQVDDMTTTWAPVPARFEAGTPPIVEAVGMAKAIDYLNDLSMDCIMDYEHHLGAYLREVVSEIPGVTVYGPNDQATTMISFNVDGIHAHDLATILDRHDVAVRAGHHCAQPLMRRFGAHATIRASLGVYNIKEDIDRLAEGITSAIEIMRV